MASVAYPHDVMAKLLAWGELAVRLGRRDTFTAALREMDERLRTDPESWGDPQNEFRSLHLTLYRRYGPVLIVYYPVHVDGSPVFVQDVQLTPNSPLAASSG
jgi:hypothetical protein